MQPVMVIKPSRRLTFEDFWEVWRYRELLYFFTWRDIKVRYRQTAIGVLWAVLQPTIAMVIFSLFFGRLAKIPSDGVPYPVFVFTGLIFWQFFSTALSESSNSLVNNQAIITKAYFPRIILPLSATITQCVDFGCALVVLGGLLLYYGYFPTFLSLFVLPLLFLIMAFATIGGGLLLAAVNVQYRDVRYALPYCIQLLLFISPVIYPASLAGKYSWILALNPMSGVITAARSVLLGTPAPNGILFGISAVAALVWFTIGVPVFKKIERHFADII